MLRTVLWEDFSAACTALKIILKATKVFQNIMNSPFLSFKGQEETINMHEVLDNFWIQLWGKNIFLYTFVAQNYHDITNRLVCSWLS